MISSSDFSVTSKFLGEEIGLSVQHRSKSFISSLKIVVAKTPWDTTRVPIVIRIVLVFEHFAPRNFICTVSIQL
jgi:hypothetical protein